MLDKESGNVWISKKREKATLDDGVKISEWKERIEIVQAGIIGNDAMLKMPWGDTRLAEKALDR